MTRLFDALSDKTPAENVLARDINVLNRGVAGMFAKIDVCYYTKGNRNH